MWAMGDKEEAIRRAIFVLLFFSSLLIERVYDRVRCLRFIQLANHKSVRVAREVKRGPTIG